MVSGGTGSQPGHGHLGCLPAQVASAAQYWEDCRPHTTCATEAKRELSVSVDNKRLEHQLAPKYLGVRLDRTLSYKQHLEEVRAKVTARVSLIRRLAGTTWGASARTL
ncbi:hypothetical protein NHX12_000775 [Muraenolepis orangiensis]|uniref:Uncharacterized protein n=1 Tax=Muraenolepis orangiensis TaxID=630683 RepID=A0A9Q0DYR5_9TELE|nr:hypothetical protein NHX12_000775 [Muraenolepis orangiensis]